jgi:hypothetical protein
VSYFNKGSLYLKGRQLAVICSSSGYGVVLEDYAVSGLSIETSSHDIISLGYAQYSVPGHMSASIDIQSMGKITTFDADQIKKQFASPEDLTVDELLKIVYRKIDERQSDDD